MLSSRLIDGLLHTTFKIHICKLH